MFTTAFTTAAAASSTGGEDGTVAIAVSGGVALTAAILAALPAPPGSRPLATAEPVVFNTELASSLSMSAVILVKDGQGDQALHAPREAVALSRSDAARDSRRRRNHQQWVENLAYVAAQVGQDDEAQRALDEAAETRHDGP